MNLITNLFETTSPTFLFSLVQQDAYDEAASEIKDEELMEQSTPSSMTKCIS